jgi:hypothetical protein
MDRDGFWQIVERARAAVGETVTAEAAGLVARQVVAELIAAGPATAVEFQERYDAVTHEGFQWELWAAAYLLKGGCSTEGFESFRGWLVAQGRTRWERAVADPDSLVDAGVDPGCRTVECAGMLAAASTAYAESTGAAEAFPAALTALRGEHPRVLSPRPTGRGFDYADDKRMRKVLPRLSASHPWPR